MYLLYWYLAGVVFFTLICRFFPRHTPEMFIPTAATGSEKYIRAGLYTVLFWPISIYLFVSFVMLLYVLKPPFKCIKKAFNWIIRNDEHG
jgi:hypothetical protein